MATKRMFSKQITESDAFLDMPPTSQLLYFHLNMNADDDGFVGNPKKIMRMCGFAEDDLKVLFSKRFLLVFENGILVIKHWLIHNAIRKDMYKETQYLEEKKRLKIKDNKAYTESRDETVTIPLQNRTIDKVRLDKVRLDKVNIAAKPQDVVNYFFELKGWANKDKDFYKKKKIIYARFLRPAKELLELCDGNLEEAKECLDKISKWATSHDLGWAIETVFKKWYELDYLKPKDKKPYIDGRRAFQKENGKWYLIEKNGEIKEYVGSLDKIDYK
jgi:hypothetical protein